MTYSTRIDRRKWQRHNWRNRVQSVLLLAIMGGFLALLGGVLWGRSGLVMLLAAGVGGALFMPALSPALVIRLSGARAITPAQAPGLHRWVAVLAERAGLPAPPRLYYLPSMAINAFTVGTRGDAALVVTAGLVNTLDGREIVGVLAHEISHVAHNDLWVMGLADLFSRMTAFLSWLGQLLVLVNLPLLLLGAVAINGFAILLLVFAPLSSTLAQLALSRTREFDADLDAARLTGDPDALASALARMEWRQGGWTRVLWPGRRGGLWSLLRTHPETRERIARLQALKAVGMSADHPPPAVPDPWEPIVPPRLAGWPPRWWWSRPWH
ncbi:zinc metalloprotease HtpX [Salinisphaera sp. LB1]|uniref:zinc metalloprotease HtpX n=1 Tax=Salinisphaera sp. LB1 TaxID=2183911 RepID=UPI000D707382|nr:zinc metalloprotease HtpX [Salinisphaera sp. LB1]AWN15940.1 Peptidase, M48 family [Salinisphaera sp. LB1]